MDKIQTPDVEHEEVWWQLVMIAYSQLYLSRSIAANLPNPWERHLPSFKQNETIKQPTMVQKDFERIIRMIGTPAQPPKTRKNSPGRQFGDIQVKRIRHPVVKKHKNIAATEKMIALLRAYCQIINLYGFGRARARPRSRARIRSWLSKVQEVTWVY